MDKKKRSTIIGAALIFIGVVAGVLVAALLTSQSKPTESANMTGSGTGGTLAVGPGPVLPLRFSKADAAMAAVRYAADCNLRPNPEQLVLQALDWDLTGHEPTVLILHTHASESYTRTQGQDYEESSQYRTLDTQYNMVALGDRLTELLERAGIRVLHDRRIHDYPSYNQAYDNARKALESYRRQYPSLQVVLDLHRDAVLLSDGSQYAPTVEVAGKKVAKLMLVVGSNGSGMEHPHWQDNLAAALKLQVLLEKATPGITRDTMLRAQRYNQDLCAGAMIVEIGTAGNTLEQAMEAVPLLAEGIIGLMHGAAASQ